MVEIQLAFAGTGTAAKDTTSYVICLFVSLINEFVTKTDRIFHLKWAHVARFTSSENVGIFFL